MGRFSKAREDQKAGAGATAPAASEGATETAPAARAPRAPKAPKAAAPAPGVGLSLQVEGGPSIPLPEGSAIHSMGLKLVDALYPADA